MMPQEPFNVDEAQRIREELLAPAYKQLEEMSETFPAYGQQLTFAKNHVRLAFMELGFGMALTNGLDPFANKVSKKEN